MSRRPPLHRRPWVWIVLALAAASGAYALYVARGPRVPTVAAARRDLEQHLVATGRVLAPARVEVASQAIGLVRAVAVREGDPVKVGDVLVELDDAEARAAVARAEGAVAQAAARAEQVTHVNAIVSTQALAQAEANLEDAQQTFDRTKSLVDAGALAPQERDGAQRALDVAKAQRESAAAQQSGAGVDAREAWASLKQAQAELATEKVRLSQTKIRALTSGTVLTRDVEPGSVVQPGHTLLVIAAAGEARLVLQPDERDLSLIALGLRARASADAYPKDTFEAEVSYVAPSVEAVRGTVEVRLRVPKPPAYLKPDMTVSVDLTVAVQKGAVVIPSETVRGLATPNPWALGVSNDHLVRRDLALGIRGEGAVEVTAGLAEGDLVVVPDGRILEPGQRVRPFPKAP